MMGLLSNNGLLKFQHCNACAKIMALHR